MLRVRDGVVIDDSEISLAGSDAPVYGGTLNSVQPTPSILGGGTSDVKMPDLVSGPTESALAPAHVGIGDNLLGIPAQMSVGEMLHNMEAPVAAQSGGSLVAAPDADLSLVHQLMAAPVTGLVVSDVLQAPGPMQVAADGTPARM